MALVGPAATLTTSTAAETTATITIQLSFSSSSAIQMPRAAAATTLATLASGAQPSQTKRMASGRAAAVSNGRRRPSACNGKRPHTSTATCESTSAEESMTVSYTGGAGSLLLRKPQRTIRAPATTAGTRRFMALVRPATGPFGLADRSIALRRLVRRDVVVPLAETAERTPEGSLEALLVEGGVDVEGHEHLGARRELHDLAGLVGKLAGEGDLGAVERLHGLFAHGDDELGVHDGELAAQMLEALGLGLAAAHLPALDDVGPVELERIDLEPLAALHERRARAPEERHALVQLGRSRLVLEHEDVGHRVAGADHRHGARVAAPGAPEDLAGELVDLRDRPGQVLVVDLIGLRHAVPQFGGPLGSSRLSGQLLATSPQIRGGMHYPRVMQGNPPAPRPGTARRWWSG